MNYKSIAVENFVGLLSQYLIVDVRSPGEFHHAHIPGAISMPLFEDEERAVVGTLYKQESREKAIKAGLDYFGPKMKNMVEQIENSVGMKSGESPAKFTILIYCWRGGMRSGAVSWLLSMYGFEVLTLKGGYKAFRNWTLDQFEKAYNFRILSGFTGSGKTELLQKMQEKGAKVIDLELIANHKGSAFGHIGKGPQPSQEYFENSLALALFYLDGSSCIWLEDESRRIGHLNIPLALWNTMSKSPVILLNLPFELRLNRILAEYGDLEREALMHGIMRIQKRLGGLATKQAINYLLDGEIKSCFEILLAYYDKYYQKHLEKNKLQSNIKQVDIGEHIMQELLEINQK